MRKVTKITSYQYWLRYVELLLLYIGVPLLYFIIPNLPLIPVLMGVALILGHYLAKDSQFNSKQLTNMHINKKEIELILLPFFLVVIIVSLWQYITQPFWIPFVLQNPFVFLTVGLIYPILSVYPQTILYRVYFKHRYQVLFKNKWTRIIVSALLFGYGHIIFGNILAPLFTCVGGVLFMYRYETTKSTITSAFEHSLYGLLMFGIGFGEFFYLR